MTITQNHHLIEIQTSLGKDYVILTNIEGQEQVSCLFHFQLQFFSLNKITEKDFLGKDITFQIQVPNEKVRYFHGFVNKFQKGPEVFQQGRHYTIDVVPWLWFLTLNTDCRVFQNKTVIEIIEQIFQEFSFKNYETSKLQSSYTSRTYCVQYNETSFNFVSRLMEEEGIFYYFRHEEGKHTLILGDHISSYNVDDNLSAEYHQQSFPRLCICEWHHEYNFCSGKITLTDFNFETPNTDLLENSQTVLSSPISNRYEVFNFPGYYLESSQGQSKSKIRMEEKESSYEIIQGEGQYCLFSAGQQFDLQNHFYETEKGKYILLSVSHYASDSSHIAGSDRLPHYYNTFKCIPNEVLFRPPSTAIKPMIDIQTAIVVGPENEEIYTDQYGRIKVQFFWDRKGQKNEKSSCWIRVAHSLAGQKWGHIFIPRIGQEVLVTFINGNPDDPLITGSVYNAQQMPPYELPTNQTQMGIKSHSLKEGTSSESNELRFEDKKGQEEVFLHAQKDLKEVVENDHTLNVLHDQIITIKNDRHITVEDGNEQYVIKQGNRDIKLEMGNQTLTLEQGNQLTKIDLGKSSLEALQEITLTVGENSLKIDQTGITLQGLLVKINGTMIQINADALLQLQGTLTEIN